MTSPPLPRGRHVRGADRHPAPATPPAGARTEANIEAVRFSGVRKVYRRGTGEVVAVNGLDLAVRRGEIVSLLGPNGAGKTTSIEMLVGLRRPTAGTIRTVGLDPWSDRRRLRSLVSVQPQHAAVFGQETVTELLRVWASLYPSPDRVESVIERLGLADKQHDRIKALSGGQRQRLLVGLALISRPQLLVLDEPSTGMDPNARRALWATIEQFRTSGGTVILSTHSMEEAEQVSDRVAILDRGQLVTCGTSRELTALHAPDTEISFVTAVQDLSPLYSFGEVLDVTQRPSDGNLQVRVRTRHSDAVLRLCSLHLGARQIHVRDSGLDEVFMRLTQGDPAGRSAEDLMTRNRTRSRGVHAARARRSRRWIDRGHDGMQPHASEKPR